MVRQWYICGFRSNFDNCAELEKLKIPVPKNLENTVAYLAIREKHVKLYNKGKSQGKYLRQVVQIPNSRTNKDRND
jgi:S-adenosylhomocysteine hydrolase